MINPRTEIVSPKTLLTIDLHNLRMTEAEKVERAPNGASMNRLPKPIENQNGMFEYGCHNLSQPIAGKLAEPALTAIQKGNSYDSRRPGTVLHGKSHIIDRLQPKPPSDNKAARKGVAVP